MSKKLSGLGRGLGDLFEDNSPEVRSSGIVVRRDESGEVTISPDAVDGARVVHAGSVGNYAAPYVHTVVMPVSDEKEEILTLFEENVENKEETKELL